MPFSHYFKYRPGGRDEDTPLAFICIPSGCGRPHANNVISMINSAALMAEAGLRFDFWLHTEDCHVDDSRNFLVQQFMKSGAKYLVFIDDDVGWETPDLLRLISHENADIVGGAYPLKQQDEDYPVRLGLFAAAEGGIRARGDGLLEVEGIGTGFMRIDRKVIEALLEKRKHLGFFGKEALPGEEKMYVLFERMIADGHRWSGDLNFCREARRLGFRVWCDPEMKFSHQGLNRWTGTFGNFLRKRNGVIDNRLDGALERLMTGDTSIETFKDIALYYGESWAMGPYALQEIYEACAKAEKPILEWGAGITTIIAGIACQRNGQMVHALEHDMEWFRRVRGMIQRWALRPIALYYAPLTEYPNPDNPADPLTWYGDGVLDNLPKEFDVAILDGPPRRYGRGAGYELVGDRIKDATWFVDDTDDKQQLAMAQAYANKFGKTLEDKGNVNPRWRGKRRYAVVK